MLTRKTSH